MKSTNIDMAALLRSAAEKARIAGLNWVGVEHVLLVLAESSDNVNVAKLTNEIEAAIRAREPANPGWETVEPTAEFVRLAQLLTFQKQFVPGGSSLSAAKVIAAIVQDNPTWNISMLLRE